jgi:hypothetical protein
VAEQSPAEARAARIKGGTNAQKPETWAKNVARAWPSLDEERRQAVMEALRPLAQGRKQVDS